MGWSDELAKLKETGRKLIESRDDLAGKLGGGTAAPLGKTSTVDAAQHGTGGLQASMQVLGATGSGGVGKIVIATYKLDPATKQGRFVINPELPASLKVKYEASTERRGLATNAAIDDPLKSGAITEAQAAEYRKQLSPGQKIKRADDLANN